MSIINTPGNDSPSLVSNWYLFIILWLKSETSGKFNSAKPPWLRLDNRYCKCENGLSTEIAKTWVDNWRNSVIRSLSWINSVGEIDVKLAG